MKRFVDFASGKTGRTLRIVTGAVFVLWAIMSLGGAWQWVVGGIGVLLVLSGVMKLCIFNLLVGRPLNACPAEK